MLEASLGQVAVTGGFGACAYVGLTVGDGLMLAGLTAAAMKAAATAEKRNKSHRSSSCIGLGLQRLSPETPSSSSFKHDR